MNNGKRQEFRLSPELANEILSRRLDKDKGVERIKYLAQVETKIMEFAKVMRAIHGRGAVIIEWPWPVSLEVIPRNVSYMPESLLRSQGMAPDHAILRAVECYDPNTQAVILLADDIRVAHNHILYSGVQANEIDGIVNKLGKQLGWSDWTELWRERIGKRDK